jgi:hypothetical protein
MPVDDRIRAGLSRNAELTHPPVEHHLDTVVRRHRRRIAAKLLAGAAAALVLAVLPWWAFTTVHDRDPEPARPSEPTLAGAYRVVIDEARTAPDLRGTWVVTLRTDGRIDVTPPLTYRGKLSGGAAYEQSGATIRTNVFVESPGCQRTDPAVGVYRVTLTGSEAVFTKMEDTCPARAALFGAPWTRLP